MVKGSLSLEFCSVQVYAILFNSMLKSLFSIPLRVHKMLLQKYEEDMK